MTSSDRIRERKICEATIQILERRLAAARGEGFSPEDQPARYNDDERVEWLQALGARQFAIEVTLVEAIPGRKEQVTHLEGFFAPLRSELDGKLPSPGIYELVIPPGALSITKNKQLSKVQNRIKEWVLRAAPGLGMKRPNHFVRETPEGVDFEVALYRFQTRRNNGCVRLAYSVPEDLSNGQGAIVRTALEKKLPKLSRWQAKSAMSVLVVETRDIPPSAEHCVAEMIVEGLEARGVVPDDLFIIDTADYLWIAYKIHASRQGIRLTCMRSPPSMKASWMRSGRRDEWSGAAQTRRGSHLFISGVPAAHGASVRRV